MLKAAILRGKEVRQVSKLDIAMLAWLINPVEIMHGRWPMHEPKTLWFGVHGGEDHNAQ